MGPASRRTEGRRLVGACCVLRYYILRVLRGQDTNCRIRDSWSALNSRARSRPVPLRHAPSRT